MTEKEMRQTLIDCGIRLLENNLVQGTWGNTSMRLDENYMLITPSGLDYETLRPEDITKVNIRSLEYEGLKPSSEKGVHSGAYLMRPDINAVIHTHPTYCSVLAAARVPLPASNYRIKELVGGEARVAKYALPSTSKLAEATLKALKERNACLMANHGVVTVGETMDAAYDVIALMEDECKAFIQKAFLDKYGVEYCAENAARLFQ